MNPPTPNSAPVALSPVALTPVEPAHRDSMNVHRPPAADSFSTRRILELMTQLQQAANERAQSEQTADAHWDATISSVGNAHDKASQELVDHHAEQRRMLENRFAAAKKTAAAEYDQAKTTIETQHREALQSAEQQQQAIVKAAEHQKAESQWQSHSLYDGTKNHPQELLTTQQKHLASLHRQVEGLQRDALALIQMRRLASAAAVEASAPQEDGETRPPTDAQPATSAPEQIAAVQGAVAQLRDSVLEMQAQRIPSLFLEGLRPIAWFWPSLAIGAALAFAVVSGSLLLTLGVALGVAVLLTAGLLAWFIPLGRRQSLAKYRDVLAQIREISQQERHAAQAAVDACRQQQQAQLATRNDELARAEELCQSTISASRHSLDEEQNRLQTTTAAQIAQFEQQRRTALEAAETHFPPLIAANANQAEEKAEQLQQQRKEGIAEANEQHEQAWQSLANQWHAAFDRVAGELGEIQQQCCRLFPDWNAADYRSWQRPPEMPGAIRFGAAALPLSVVRNGAPTDPRLQTGIRGFELPALMTLNEQPNFVAVAEGAGRRKACDLLQLLMLRLLTTAPAGKIRFTAIDAAGLGENFGGFMHLADQHEQLLGKQIWTSSQDVLRELARISEHIERVLQKYLRNDFATIHEYNADAGEVAEAYRFVVVANYPEGFNETAAKRLANIAAAGPRCGVHVLMSVDQKLRLPHDTSLKPYLENAVHLEWQSEAFRWRYPLFERLPLVLDEMPSPERLNEVLKAAGEASRLASIVEVPFATVAPEDEHVWTQDSGDQLSVSIGRAGARELQSLKLGKGTSQHALISGKTGSGKSTLLHALITNLALHYGPDQVEFYLVDFKKGVEFKAYAAGNLPHARVIAIESEREFGVSVLERVDQELRRRGELFRLHGVQDLAAARQAAPEELLPRTLLIIDEFQELFVADDKLAQDASLLLDRLVRQGRAFGIHVILGSQTLSGAYSLARSTLGQMAVRIALECSEADANLILSDENSAARLLSRPGEAIYNDQNGFVEGNHPFQVVWLPDAQRREYLATLRERAQDKSLFPPAIVFEGNVPADPSENPALVALKDSAAGESVAEIEPGAFWLGSDVRIGPPVKLALQRQSGANLLIVGGDESLALGMLTAIVSSLAAGGETPARFTILDGVRQDSAQQHLWQPFASVLGDRLETVSPQNVKQTVETLSEELLRRTDDPQNDAPSHYVVIRDLSQFRDLRLTEDEYSFLSAKQQTASADKSFRQLLREGPSVGIHVILWSESYNSLTRFIDRLTLREADFRVAMQMSAADSTSLVDSPAAGMLGEHRGILYRDDLGTQTKFRPYGLPDEAGLEKVAQQIAPRVEYR